MNQRNGIIIHEVDTDLAPGYGGTALLLCHPCQLLDNGAESCFIHIIGIIWIFEDDLHSFFCH